jgi:TPR repeat protein
LERNNAEDRDAALKLLERAVQLGDEKASARLNAMRLKATVPAVNENK